MERELKGSRGFTTMWPWRGHLPTGPRADLLYDCDILNYSLCADGPGRADLGEEGGQLRENKEQTGSWAVIQEGSNEREGDGSTSWC